MNQFYQQKQQSVVQFSLIETRELITNIDLVRAGVGFSVSDLQHFILNLGLTYHVRRSDLYRNNLSIITKGVNHENT